MAYLHSIADDVIKNSQDRDDLRQAAHVVWREKATRTKSRFRFSLTEHRSTSKRAHDESMRRRTNDIQGVSPNLNLYNLVETSVLERYFYFIEKSLRLEIHLSINILRNAIFLRIFYNILLSQIIKSKNGIM